MAKEKGTGRYGKGNQNVTPGWMSWKTRDDGTTRVNYGKKGQDRPHGHSERRSDGTIKYSRSIGGHERKKS